MSESLIISGITKQEKYEALIPQIKALVEGESDFIANLSNIMSALKYGMDFFWAGVYFVRPAPVLPNSTFSFAQSLTEKGNENAGFEGSALVLGPFQGTIACTRITYGKGVCGTAWKEKRTIIVEDVDNFPGHIACSSVSKSEIVLPGFTKNNEVFLVLDIDSEHHASFDQTDKLYLEKIVEIICRCAK